MNNTTPPIHKESMVHAKARPGNAPVQFPTTYHTASLLPAQHHQLPSDESKMDEDLSHSKASCVTQIAGMASPCNNQWPFTTPATSPRSLSDLKLNYPSPLHDAVIYRAAVPADPIPPSITAFHCSMSIIHSGLLTAIPAIRHNCCQNDNMLVDTVLPLGDFLANHDFTDGTVSQDSRDSPMSTTGACRSNSNSSDSSTEYSGMYLHESGTTSTSSNTSYELGSSSSPHRHKRYTVRTSASCVNSALSDWSSSSSSETSTQQMIVIPSSSRSTETDATKGGSGHVPLHPNNQMASPAQQRDSLSQHPWRQYQEHVTANKTFRTDSGWSSQPGQDLAPPSRLQSVISSSAHMQTPVHAHSPQLLGSDSRASTAASNDTAPSASEPSNSGQDVLDPNGEDPAIRRAEQNRAAQRAFRLRKQKYIKWLEGKASELDEVYRIMAIVRAENQQLCNMVMELRGQVQQLYGELNPGMAAPNFLASGSGGTASTMIGHGIEVTRVGDHYESTLGREISMRLMNLGSFKNGGSEGRPRYQPRSSSSGSSSKRKSSTKTDQTWVLQQQQVEQLRAMQLSPSLPPRTQAMGNITSVLTNSMQSKNLTGSMAPPGIASGTISTATPTTIVPGPQFGLLPEHSHSRQESIPLATKWVSNEGKLRSDEPRPPGSTFSIAADHSAQSTATNHTHLGLAKSEPLPLTTPALTESSLPSTQTNPPVLTSSFIPLKDDSPKLLVKREIPLNGSNSLSLKRRSVCSDNGPLSAPPSHSTSRSMSFSITKSQQPIPISVAGTHSAHVSVVESPTAISCQSTAADLGCVDAMHIQASQIPSDIANTAISHPIVNVPSMVTLPAAPVIDNNTTHAPLNIVIPSLPNSSVTTVTSSAITGIVPTSMVSPRDTTATSIIHPGDNGLQVLAPPAVDAIQPQVPQLVAAVEAVPPAPAQTLVRPTVPVMATQPQPLQQPLPQPAIQAFSGTAAIAPVTQSTPSQSIVHQLPLGRTFEGLDPFAIERGRRLSMPTIHLAIPNNMVAEQPSTLGSVAPSQPPPQPLMPQQPSVASAPSLDWHPIAP